MSPKRSWRRSRPDHIEDSNFLTLLRGVLLLLGVPLDMELDYVALLKDVSLADPLPVILS
jgi:hypothetical protein